MKFSIITVSYNSEKTIERTIKSILSQTYQDYEYIVVDGASKDSTIDIVKAYNSEFNGKLKYVSEPDKGIYDAMNKGIKIAQGEIIGIVNSDDWLDSQALDNILSALESTNNPNAVYTGDICYHYQDGTTQIISYNQKDLDHYAKVWRLGINHPATFVPKALYEKYGIFDINIKLQADSDFIDRLYYNNVKFVFLDHIISNQSDGGASTNNLDKSLKDYKYVLNKNMSNSLKRYLYYIKYWIAVQLKKHAPLCILKLHRK